MEQLKAFLGKLPIIPILVCYCAWLGYDHYSWLTASDSELAMKKGNLVATKQDLEATKKKLAAGEQFYKTLETVRSRILVLNAQLDSTKAVLSAEVDLANFVNLISLEAKKLGLTIKSIKPESEDKKEYYTEVPFAITIKGAYVQILVFLDRVAKFQQVIRVPSFHMKPTGSVFSKFVELDAGAKLVAYKYVGTHVDDMVNKEEMKSAEKLDKAATVPAKEGKDK